MLRETRQRTIAPALPSSPLSGPASTMISSAVTRDTTPARLAMTTAPDRWPLSLEPRADERRARIEERNSLALHVRAHERAVRVVMLEERDERRGDRDELLRRHVHVIDSVLRVSGTSPPDGAMTSRRGTRRSSPSASSPGR